MGLDSRFKSGFSTFAVTQSVGGTSQHMFHGVFRVVMAPFIDALDAVSALNASKTGDKAFSEGDKGLIRTIAHPILLFLVQKDKWSRHNTSVRTHTTPSNSAPPSDPC